MIKAASRAYSPAGFILVAGLHLFALYLLSHDPRHVDKAPVPRYSRLQFIFPLRQLPVVATPKPHSDSAANGPAKPFVVPPRTIPEPNAAITAPAPIEDPAPPDNTDPFNEPARFNIDDLVRQAGKADRDTRTANEMAIRPATDSIEAVMTKAFNEAKLAVPLKWYEAARIELFSAPNDPKKIYQVKTAFGTYCLFYPSMYEEVGDRQPKMSSCPKRFGKRAK